MKIAAIVPSSHLTSSENSLGNAPPLLATPCSPIPYQTCSTKSPSQVAVEFAQQIIEALKSTNAKQGPPPPFVEPSGAEKPKARASTLEFKSLSFYRGPCPIWVKLISYSWDAKAYKYKIVESLTPPDEENELDQYIFVVRTRIDKKEEKSTHHVDVKSAGLRDVLRLVLRDVNGISLREEKPSVQLPLAFP